MDLYHRHRGDHVAPTSGLSILHKIRFEHIQLTSYSKMRVDLAAQVKKPTLCLANINFYASILMKGSE